MAKPRPSLMLAINVSQEEATKDMRLEVGRCFTYVASTVLHARPEGDTGPNTLDFLVKMGTRKYLRSTEEGADELWSDVIERWLYNQFRTVGNNILIFNRRQREEGNEELSLQYLDVDMENGACKVRFRLDSNSSLPAEASEQLSRVRELLNSGVLGEGAVQVQVPSEAAYGAQLAAWESKAEERAEQARLAQIAEEEAARKAAEEAAAAAEESFAEAPDMMDTTEEDLEAQMRREVEEKYALPEADFAIDFSRWAVLDASGQWREFDSVKGAYVD